MIQNTEFRLTATSHSVILSVIVLYSLRLGKLFFLLPLMKNSEQLEAIANPVLAERINGWAAMMGFWALVGAYVSTGQIIPGIV